MNPIIEGLIEKQKILYNLAKGYKTSRTETLTAIITEYQKFKKLSDSKGIFTTSEYSDAVRTSSDFIKNTFPNSKLHERFEYIPVINIPSLKAKKESSNKEPEFLENLFLTLGKVGEAYISTLTHEQKQKESVIGFRLNFLVELHNSIKQFGLHPAIEAREPNFYCLLIITGYDRYIKWNISWDELHNDYVRKYENINNTILINGIPIIIKSITRTVIISHFYKEDEIPLYCEKKEIGFNNSENAKALFIFSFENQADSILPKDIDTTSLIEDVKKAAVELKTMLITPKISKGDKNKKFGVYVKVIRDNSSAWELAPWIIKNYHSFDEYWENHKDKIGRVMALTDVFQPLLEFLEKASISSGVKHITKNLDRLDVNLIDKYWKASIDRLEIDPEDAISRSKTLLETTFKCILDDRKIEYDTYKDEFHRLFKAVRDTLQLAPGGEHEDIFRRIVNGCANVMDGINEARGKFGSSHGKSEKQLINPAIARHAELVVTLSGAMATFLVRSWKQQ